MDETEPAPARRCETCLTPLPGTNPRRRFCGPPCKAEGWRRAHTNETRTPTPRKTPTPPPPSAIRDCPHCAKPIAIVTLLAAPHAARVNPPTATC
jgi:hypothetical protein